jgi:hypothetical protein
MDSLNDLPVNDSIQLSQQEKATIEELFPQSEELVAAAEQSRGSSKRRLNIKGVLYFTVLFLLLANPWVDDIFCKIPKCANSATVFAVKTVIFLLGVVLIQMFLI